MTKENKVKRLSDVIIAMEGVGIYEDCVMGLKQCCEDNPCPLHKHFKSIRKEIINMLQEYTLGDLGEIMKQGDVFLRLQ